MKLAITGGTGFVGREVIRQALLKGHEVRALARSPQSPLTGVEWIDGAIDPARNLDLLVAGTDAVIHVAGAISAKDRAAFARCNIDGTGAVMTAAAEAGIRRFIHVSSLVAREPALSDYGWSKAEAERRVETSGLDWTIVRPPAIYGPTDREMVDLFKMAARGLVLLPSGGRLSLIAVEDVASLLLASAQTRTGIRKIFEPDDGAARGWTKREFAQALGTAVGRPVRTLSVPGTVLHGISILERAIRRDRAKLTADRVRYFCHPDWVARRSMAPPVRLWKPKIVTADGLKATAQAYRAAGWL